MSSHVSIVLAGPQGDANIGATARAMKNFGITDLRLVDSADHLTKTAYMWAVEARDVLENARIYKTLNEALEDISCAIALTRRLGSLRKSHMDISDVSYHVCKKAVSGRVALVFGREDKGLSNAEVRRCDIIATIPASDKLPSLNLSQAVLLACYEISKKDLETEKKSLSATQQFASRHEISSLMERVHCALLRLGYDNAPNAFLLTKISRRIERIFGRAGLMPRDVGMIEGLVARVMERLET